MFAFNGNSTLGNDTLVAKLSFYTFVTFTAKLLLLGYAFVRLLLLLATFLGSCFAFLSFFGSFFYFLDFFSLSFKISSFFYLSNSYTFYGIVGLMTYNSESPFYSGILLSSFITFEKAFPRSNLLISGALNSDSLVSLSNFSRASS